MVTWDDAGDPEVWALLTYSQSQEPDSPHYADQTRLYSRGEWLRLPFREDEIAADPNLRTVRVSSGGG